jgi:transcriptional regulator with XRE-family HTH domain
VNHKKAQQVIGQCICHFREQRKLTLEGLAAAAGITYQYLSGIENGKENFSILVLEELAAALQISINTLIALAYEPEANQNIVPIQSAYFRPQVPLPPNLTIEHLEAAANQTIVIIHQLNQNLLRETAKPLHKYCSLPSRAW